MPPSSSNPPFQARQNRLAQRLQASGFEAMALNPGPSLTYFSGLGFHLMERPVVALFPARGAPVIVLPELELLKTRDLSYPLQVFAYPEDPRAWPGVFKQALQAAGLDSQVRIGLEPLRLRVVELRYLEGAAPQASFIAAGEVIASLRAIKDEHEVVAMRQAVRIAQDSLLAALEHFRIGMTEKELAAELTLQLLRHGSESELPFAPIVSAGPNSANPHASPSERRIETGDLLVIDWGAVVQGYVSDLTRTFAIGQVEPELQLIARVVAEANAAGRAAAGPDISAGAVDAAARRVIEAAGYGAYFVHRTGHGLGLEGHEDPYIRGDNEEPLIPGNTFTVEPGIYLPGRNGVRIEDNLVITTSGAETLSDLPRELRVLG